MKIGVLSDTHLSELSLEFKKMIEFHFGDVEKILHAGDFVDWSVAEYLSGLKELIAVCGNMDPFKIRNAPVYGHTHTPANHQNKGLFFFNPGSPTRSFWHGATLGILTIGEKIEGKIIKI